MVNKNLDCCAVVIYSGNKDCGRFWFISFYNFSLNQMLRAIRGGFFQMLKYIAHQDNYQQELKRSHLLERFKYPLIFQAFSQLPAMSHLS
jgi:hypothetical protein